MGFFNQLGKKASETYQVTKEKAVNISEELKLKGKISDLKDKISKAYKEIGEIVYNEIKDGKDVSKDEVTTKCEEISRYKDEISKLETEILAIRKVKKCDSCGEELELDAAFCSKCGKEQPKIEKVEVKEKEPQETKEAEVIEINNVNEEAKVDTNVENTEENSNNNEEDNQNNEENSNE